MVVQVLKRILNKRNLKSNYTKKSGFRKRRMRGMKLMQIHELKKNILGAKEKMN